MRSIVKLAWEEAEAQVHGLAAATQQEFAISLMYLKNFAILRECV
jgi:hypothetical protein